jgi:thiamine pyrophosphokinase
MSSHHIVKDNQEPALVLLASEVSRSILDPLLEWSPLVIALEDAMELVADAGIKVDYFLYSSTGAMLRMRAIQSPVEFLPLGEERIASVKKILEQRSQKGACFAGDSLNEQEWTRLAQTRDLAFSLFTEDRRISLLNRSSYRKWFPAGTILEILHPVRQSAYILTGRLNKRGNFIHVTEDGLISISSHDILLVSEPV